MLNKAPNLKGTLKSKMRSSLSVRPGSEAMMELLTQLFLKSLAEEARARAYEERSATIRVHHVKAVSKSMLKKFRG